MRALPKTILVDIDGTIAVPVDDPDPSVKYGRALPIKSVIEQLHRARAKGFKIVLYTARGMLTKNGDLAAAIDYAQEATVNWLAEHGVPYDEIQWGKPSSCLIVDDLSVRPSRLGEWLDHVS